jgi:hypothetical protein
MVNKDIKKLMRSLADQGFDVEPTKKGHLRVYLDGIWVTTLPGTPSDWRSYRNAVAALKRAGYKPP